MKKKRVLIINHEFPPIGGGAATASDRIAKGLSSSGAEVLVMTSSFKNLKGKSDWHDITLWRIPSWRRSKATGSFFEAILFTLSALFYSLIAAVRFKPDVIISFFGVPAGIIALWLKKVFRKPYIISMRGIDVPGSQSNEPLIRYIHLLIKPLLMAIWKNASALVANSESLKKLALDSAPSMAIKVINNGVDVKTYQPPRDKIRKSPISILFVGRLRIEKGIQTFIEAINILRQKKCASFKVDIVGDGKMRNSLQRYAEACGMTDVVLFHGWKASDVLPEMYCRSDIFVIPSFYEGMSNALFEAMASGLPIIASDIPSNSEFVKDQDNGLLFPAGDSNKLASSLQRLIEDESLCKHMGINSRHIAEYFGWHKTVQHYAETIDEIIS
ncbi:MAG: glycosyltransferase family 4 protein [Candidatus Omnitrophica bacterium]|nr:glycosyltransferase family 4 protein [Candidatus Omnitrophota bacterium]